MSIDETVRPAEVVDASELVIDLTEARLRRSPTVTPSSPGVDPDLLRRVTVLLGSTLELDEVLTSLARLALDASGGARCSLFLVEGDHLRPAVALGRVADQDLAAAFREMGPIRTSDIAAAWRRVHDAGVLVIEDARRSTLIPSEWVARFDLHAVVVVPLRVGDEAGGVMVVDYPDGDVLGDAQVRLLETLTGCAAIAVRNARLYAAAERRAATQHVLARCAAALVDVDSPTTFAAVLVDGYARLLGADPCAIGLFDAAHTRVTTLAIHGRGETGPIPMATIPVHITSQLATTWTEDPAATVAFDADPWLAEMAGGRHAPGYRIVPLTVAGLPRGCVVLGWGDRAVRDTESDAAAEALRDLAIAALERTSLLNRVRDEVRRMEVLFATSSAVVAGADAAMVASRLRDLLAGHAISVVDLVLQDRTLIDRFGTARPSPAERAAWAEGETVVGLEDGITSVAMHIDGRVIGGLRVRMEDDPGRLAFLEAVGRGVAEVLTRAGLRTALDDAARQVAIAAERDRIAADLHDTAGQLMVAIGLLGRRAFDRLPSDSDLRIELGRIAELADGGKWEIDQAVRALTHVPAGDRGLPAALVALAEDFQHDSGIDVLVDVTGTPHRLPADGERALYRVAHEALSNAWRHARAAAVRISLVFGDEVRLTVTDDGVGLAPGRHRAGVGLLSVRRALEQAGGSVVVADAEPRGVRVDVRLPGASR